MGGVLNNLDAERRRLLLLDQAQQKEATHMTYNDRNGMRNRNGTRDGMAGGTMALIALAALLIIGGLVYAFNRDDNQTASNDGSANRASQSTTTTPPAATTGSGAATTAPSAPPASGSGR
jgi:hypothetical protein